MDESINFNELAPGKFVPTFTRAMKQYVVIKDLIMLVCDKSKEEADDIWETIDAEHDLAFFCTSDMGNNYGITFKGVLFLVPMLPAEDSHKVKAFKILYDKYLDEINQIERRREEYDTQLDKKRKRLEVIDQSLGLKVKAFQLQKLLMEQCEKLSPQGMHPYRNEFQIKFVKMSESVQSELDQLNAL